MIFEIQNRSACTEDKLIFELIIFFNFALKILSLSLCNNFN